MSFIDFECFSDHVIYIVSWKIFCFIPCLKDFVLVYKFFHLTSCGILRYEIYTWYYCCFNWYHWILSIGINIDIFVCSYIFFLYVCFQLVSSILIGTHLSHTSICFICAYYIPIFLSTNFVYAKLECLNVYHVSID